MLKDLADEAGVAWRYAPLHVFLAEYLAGQAVTATAAVASSRVPLPLV